MLYTIFKYKKYKTIAKLKRYIKKWQQTKNLNLLLQNLEAVIK